MHFASTSDNPQILNFYINNLPLLEDYLNRFVQKMGKALDHTLPGKLCTLEGYTPPQKPSQKKNGPKIILMGNQEITLSNKQFICFDLIKKGFSSKKIAKFLGISPRTVETHTAIILDKLKIHSRYDLIDLPAFIKPE